MSNVSVAGILRKDRRFLVMHRLPGGCVGGLWEFPGGKCEAGESPAEALRREWTEETGLTVEAGRELGRSAFEHGGESFTLVALEVLVPAGPIDPALREHDDWRWVTFDELNDLPLVDSDRSLLDVLI